VLSDAPGTFGAVCSPPDGVVVGAAAGLVRARLMITEPPMYCEEKIASTSGGHHKMPAAAVVSLLRKLPGPRGPNTVGSPHQMRPRCLPPYQPAAGRSGSRATPQSRVERRVDIQPDRHSTYPLWNDTICRRRPPSSSRHLQGAIHIRWVISVMDIPALTLPPYWNALRPQALFRKAPQQAAEMNAWTSCA